MKRTCVKCNKKKWWFMVKKRTMRPEGFTFDITSNGQLCKKCFAGIKKMIK